MRACARAHTHKHTRHTHNTHRHLGLLKGKALPPMDSASAAWLTGGVQQKGLYSGTEVCVRVCMCVCVRVWMCVRMLACACAFVCELQVYRTWPPLSVPSYLRATHTAATKKRHTDCTPCFPALLPALYDIRHLLTPCNAFAALYTAAQNTC
jgi:hypothetical protein